MNSVVLIPIKTLYMEYVLFRYEYADNDMGIDDFVSMIQSIKRFIADVDLHSVKYYL